MLNELMKYLPESDKPTGGLFPGLDPSVFDEHRTNKQAPPNVKKIERQITRLESLKDSAIKHGNKIKKVFHAGNTWGSQQPNRQALGELPWIDKYPLTREDLRSVTVATDSPKFNKLERLISSYETTLDQRNRYEASAKRLTSKLTRVRKKEAEQGIKDRSASIPKVNVDVDKIPRSLPVTYRTDRWATPKNDTFENPYFVSGAGKTAYAGHPAHFTGWKGKLQTMYYELEKWVKELGYPELDMMYAATSGAGFTNEHLRYYITNSDGSFIVANDRYKKIHVFAKRPNSPAGEPPIRWRMKRLRRVDIEWLADKLRQVQVRK